MRDVLAGSRVTTLTGGFGWKPDIRTRFLRELRDCSASVGTAVRKSYARVRSADGLFVTYFTPRSLTTKYILTLG